MKSDESRATPLHDEYRRRVKNLTELRERSDAMERDFLQTKVLNRDANTAMRIYDDTKSAFANWLLKNHEALFAVSETATRFVQCQYAKDVGMPEHSCSKECVYAKREEPK